jgi:hypothetical protein
MTGQLHVRLECGWSGDSGTGLLTTLVGSIYAVTPGNPSLRQVALPLGWQASPEIFELPAGRYVVEAVLPSGRILSEDVEVPDGEDVVLQFDLTESPYESHMLQYVVGNIEPSAVYHSHERYPVPNSRGSRAFTESDASSHDAEIGRPEVDLAVLPRGEAVPLPIAGLNGLLERSPRQAMEAVAELLGQPGPPTPVRARFADSLSPIFRFDADTAVTMSGFDWQAHRFQYLTAEAPDKAYLVTLPWPWPDSRGGSIAVEVLLNLRQSPTGSAVSVAVRDPVVGGGLGYLSAGSLHRAAVVLTNVEAMLQGKVRNPLAATAGGYVLIGTETRGEPQRWDHWLGNLRDWFPELSDGAILWGARRLRTARDQTHVNDARLALLEGYHRGLPVYTLGLTWLIDGLSAFPEDPECAAALQQVRHLCWRVDMREPFVVLRLGENQ